MKKTNYSRVVFGIAILLVISMSFCINLNNTSQNYEENSNLDLQLQSLEYSNLTYSQSDVEDYQLLENKSLVITNLLYNQEFIDVPISDHIWSPDGSKVAYIKAPNEQAWNCELWVADKNPTNEQLINHQLIYFGAEYNGLLDWKGDWILFRIRFEQGTPSSYYGRNELWKIRADGTDLTQVTFTYTNGIKYQNYYVYKNRGSAVYGWFIPGADLVYFSAHNGNGWYRTFICNDDGSDNWQHVSYPDFAFTVSMSPTGNKLLWGHATYWNRPTNLRVCNVDGSGRNTVKVFTKRTGNLVLSDGNTVIWGNNDNIYAINMDGSNARTVIDDGYVNRWLNYDPSNGQKLIMGSDRSDGNLHLYSIKTDGTELIQLTDGAFMDTAPQYSPDGNYISYLRLPDDFDPGSMSQPYPYELVVKNFGAPIKINSPTQNQVIGVDAPTFDLTINIENLDSTYYSLDGGVTKIHFSGTTGTINQLEWDKIDHGTASIIFYASDIVGNIEQAEVIVIKDIIAPIITVISPSIYQRFGATVPTFELLINEENLDTTSYSLDGGITKLFFSNPVGIIDKAEWDKIDAGLASITFFASDSAGNIEQVEVIVIKELLGLISYEKVTDHIWSPDGTKLAYIKSPDGNAWNCELWVADKNPLGAQLSNHQLIYFGAEFNGLLDWQGDWILFRIRFERGTPSSYYGRNELWKIRTDGTDFTQVTFTYTNGIKYQNYYVYKNRGSAVYGWFIPETDLVYFSAHNGNGWYRSFICNDDGSDNWQHRSYPNYAFTISMSPTGNKLLWGHATYWNRPTNLRACNVDGSGRNTVKIFTKRTGNLVLSDGNTVIWHNNDNIYAINMEGSNERTVIDDEYVNRWFNYNPIDGQKLIMGSDRSDGNMHLYSIKTDGNEIVQLTDGAYTDTAPHYSPDGNNIAYLMLPEDFDPGGMSQPYPYEMVVKNLEPMNKLHYTLLECLSRIQDLKTGDITNEALNYLNQAENKVYLAIEKVSNLQIAVALYQLKDIIKILYNAENQGVYVTDFVNLLVRNSDSVVYLKIAEAEVLLLDEPNRHLEKAWIYYYKAVEYWVEGKYEFAVSYYAKAYEKVDDALTL